MLLPVAAVVLLWPLVPLHEIPGHPLSDVCDHYWGQGWWGGELLAGRLPLRSAASHLPLAIPHWYPDPLGALLALLFRPLGFPLAFDAALFVVLVLNGVVAYAVALTFTPRRSAALLAGLAVETCPYTLGLLHNGTTEYLGLFLPLLFLFTLQRALEGRGRAFTAGALLAACTLQCLYYGIFAGLWAVCSLVGPGLRHRAGVVGRALASGALLSAPIVAAIAWTLWSGHGPVRVLPEGMRSDLPLPGVDLTLFLRPGSRCFPDLAAAGNDATRYVHYLGWFLTLLGIWGLGHHPRLRTLRVQGLLWGVVCAGPVLVCCGEPVRIGPHPVPLPMALLYAIPYSPLAHIHHPYRAVAFLVPLLALGAAAAVARWPRWLLPLLAAAMLAETALLSPAIWPLPRTDVRPPPIYAHLTDPGAVLSWPADKGTWNHAYRAWQVSHGRPIAQGVNVSLTPPVLRDNLVRDLLFAQVRPPAPRAGSRGRRPERPAPGEPSDLGAMGFRWLVLHEANLPPGEAAPVVRRLQAWLGEPALVVGDDRAWRIPAEAIPAPTDVRERQDRSP